MNESAASVNQQQHRVVEFYSGIGGWASALRLIDPTHSSIKVVAAFDVNTAANEVYELNYGLKPSAKSLEHVTQRQLESLDASIWVMSPPCQPYTRNNQTDSRDTKDGRSKSFVKIMELLLVMSNPPDYLALENVVGFEESEACKLFLETLASRQYTYQQYILSPSQFGTPNERPRYYCVAARLADFTNKRDNRSSAVSISAVPQAAAAAASGAASGGGGGACVPVDMDASYSEKLAATSINLGTICHYPPHVQIAAAGNATATDSVTTSDVESRSLQHYVDTSLTAEQLEKLFVPEKLMEKTSSWCFDIRTIEHRYTSCFTKSYSRYIKGTGSVLLIETAPQSLSEGTETAEKLGGSVASSSVGAKRPYSKVESEHVPPVAVSAEGANTNSKVAINTIVDHVTKLTASESALAAAADTTMAAPKPINKSDLAPEDRVFSSSWWEELNDTGTKKLRFFSPWELLGIFGFENRTFRFPSSITQHKWYELIGNSLNVTVVEALLRHVLTNTSKTSN